MKVIGISIIIGLCIVASYLYWLAPSAVDADHGAVPQPQIKTPVATEPPTQLPGSKLPSKPALQVAQQKLPGAASQSRLTTEEESTSLVLSDLSQDAQDTKLQEIKIQRLGLADADQVVQIIREHPDAQVRKAAIEKLAQLEMEYEATYSIERRSGDPGQFVLAIAENLPNESNPAALDASLDYLVEYAENDLTVRQSLENLLQRSDLSPDVLARVYELLIERYDLSRDDAQAQIYASPTILLLSNEDSRQLEENLAQLE